MADLRTIGKSAARLGRHDTHFYVARPFTALLKKLNQTQFDFMIVDLDVALTLARMAVTNPDELVGAQIPLSYPYYKRYAEMHETDVPTWCFSRIK